MTSVRWQDFRQWQERQKQPRRVEQLRREARTARRGLLPTLLNPRRVAQIWGAKAVKRLEDEL